MKKQLSPAQQETLKRQSESMKGRPSNNPGGRPRMAPDLKAAFKSHGQEALDTLLRVMRDPNARPADQVRASEVILNRGWGMPTQQVEVDVNHSMSITSALDQMRALQAAREQPMVIEAKTIDITPPPARKD